MPPFRNSVRALAAGLVGLLLAASALGARPADDPAARLQAALAADDLVAARAALGDWIEREPAYAALHYNLACLESQLHEPERAVRALTQAFRLGFDDVRRAAVDPDLAPLADAPAFRTLLQETVAGLERAARRRAMVLTEGEALPLTLRDAAGRPVAGLEALLAADPSGFDLTLTVTAGALADGPAPWREGGGLVLTLAAPGPGDVFDTANAWRFGFGLREGLPVGVVLARPDRVLEQQVLELAPEVRWNMAAGTRRLTARVPWAYLAPYAPPADSLFGVNLHWVAVPGGGLPAAAAVPDPAAPAGGPGPRRYLPLTLRPRPDGPVRFGGLVPNTVVGRAPLPVDLVAWTAQPAAGVLSVTVEDNEGRSVVASGGEDEAVELAPGRNVWRRWADLSSLPEGPYRLRARLVLADSTAAEWRTGLFRFGGDWAYRARDRAKGLPPSQRPSLDWRLGLVESSLSTRDPRGSPAPLLTTVAETEGMLRAYDARGTILPEAGEITLAFPADQGLQPVRLLLPRGWAPDAPPAVLALAVPHAAALMEELGAAIERTDVAVALALPPTPLAAGDRDALRNWLEELLPGAAVRLVGGGASDLAVAPEDAADADARRAAARRLLDNVAGGR